MMFCINLHGVFPDVFSERFSYRDTWCMQ